MMPKLPGLPPKTCTLDEVETILGRNRQSLKTSGILDFLEYWQVGTSKLFDLDDVANMRYWLHVRDGQIALGLIGPKAPLLPPGRTDAERRRRFDAWIDDDLYGIACSQCGGEAVQDDLGGDIWCKGCGILFNNKLEGDNK